jgi:hypothetical protein
MDIAAILAGGASTNPLGAAASTALSFLGGLFKKKNSPNDWKGWDALDSQYNEQPGTSPSWWVITDGDSVANEALNIVSYITNKTDGLANMLMSRHFTGLTPVDALKKIAEKVRRGGFASEANQLLEYLKQTPVNNQIISSFPTTKPPIVQTTFIDPNTYTVGGQDYYDMYPGTDLSSNKLVMLAVPLVIVVTLVAVFWKAIKKMFK